MLAPFFLQERRVAFPHGCWLGGNAMRIPRRRFLYQVASAAALPAVSLIARAQAYPARPVRIVAGFAAGGGADITARLIGQWLSERLGQQFLSLKTVRERSVTW
jgi:hypothetical protein